MEHKIKVTDLTNNRDRVWDVYLNETPLVIEGHGGPEGKLKDIATIISMHAAAKLELLERNHPEWSAQLDREVMAASRPADPAIALAHASAYEV